jgi:archaellum component FlaC
MIILEQERGSPDKAFEIEMRTTLTRLSVKQDDLTNLISVYLDKTCAQEIESSRVRSEIDTIFHNLSELKKELKDNKLDIAKIIDDKIDSIYKMAGATAIVLSLFVTIIGMIINMNMK